MYFEWWGNDEKHFTMDRPKGSYRSIQRFFRLKIDWLRLNRLLFCHCYLNPSSGSAYVLALDEVVEEKAGKKIFGKVIRSVSTHVISLVDTDRERSYVLNHSQTVKPAKKRTRKSKGKGSTNKSGIKSKGSTSPAQKPKAGRSQRK